MSDATTSNLVDILAGHNYGSSASPVTQFGTPCPKTLWETEVYFGSGSDITNGLALAQEIHSFLTVAGASAYHYWWLKTYGGNGCLAGDSTVAPAKRLYVMGNYSRFVRPDFYRVGVTNSTTALVSAFKEPSSSNFVIVAANNSMYPVNQTFTLTNFPIVGPLRQWVTSASESLANRGGLVSVTNGTFTAILPPWTITTYLYQQPMTNLPSIAQQPTSQLLLPGDTATFSVQASGGTVALYYQWFFNGTNSIVGATNASFLLAGANITNAGNYSVVVTNFAGSVTSSVASLTFNTIVWSAANTVSGATDIATNGSLLYAYNNSGSAATVNAVTFTGVNSVTAWGTGVVLDGWDATSTSAFSGGTSAPWNGLPAGYKTILQGGVYNGGGVATVTLKNLVVGHQYQVQVWVNDSRAGSTTNRTEILSGAMSTSVTLAYNNTYAAGGVGQFAIGSFVATATNQSFTMDGNASTQLNALQVRDVTPITVFVTPATTNLVYGNSVNLTATANGAPPFSYKWYDNITNAIPWGTNAILTLTNPLVAGGGNYTVTVQSGGDVASNVALVNISKALLVVTANNTNRTYGTTNPIFSGSLTGIQNGDVITATFTSPASTNSPAGNYVIAPVLNDPANRLPNYNVTTNLGILTITLASNSINLTSTVSGSNLTLTWPLTHVGWTLQVQTNTLSGIATNWVDIANSTATNRWIILVTPLQPAAFYRLRR
jgi:hypothetical protein